MLCDQICAGEHATVRPAACLMASLGISRGTISLCLDHTIKTDDSGNAIPAVTGKHYDQDPRIAEKRAALQKLADEIRRIVAEPAEAESWPRRKARGRDGPWPRRKAAAGTVRCSTFRQIA